MDNRNGSGEELTFRDIWNYVKKSIPLVLVCVIVCCAAAGAAGLVFSLVRRGKDTAAGTVDFMYKGIEEGKDPAGAALNVEEMKGVQVISDALEKTGLAGKYSVNDVRGAVRVTGIVPESYLNAMDEWKKKNSLTPQQIDEMAYRPTSFCIELDTRLGKDRRIPDNEARNLVDAIMASYTEIFNRRYVDVDIMNPPILSDEDIEKDEFTSSIDTIRAGFYKASVYLEAMTRNSDSRDHVGSDGDSFLSCQRDLEVQDDKLSALVSALTENGTVRYRDRAIANLNSFINELSDRIEAKEKTIETTKDFMAAYKENFPEITVAAQNKDDGTSTVPVVSLKPLEQMTAKLTTLRSEVEALEIRKRGYERWLEGITAGEDSSEEDKMAATEEIKELNANVQTLSDRINVLTKSCAEKVYATSVRTGSGAVMMNMDKPVPWLKILIIAVVIGAAAGFILQPSVSRARAGRKARKAVQAEAAGPAEIPSADMPDESPDAPEDAPEEE